MSLLIFLIGRPRENLEETARLIPGAERQRGSWEEEIFNIQPWERFLLLGYLMIVSLQLFSYKTFRLPSQLPLEVRIHSKI